MPYWYLGDVKNMSIRMLMIMLYMNQSKNYVFVRINNLNANYTVSHFVVAIIQFSLLVMPVIYQECRHY